MHRAGEATVRWFIKSILAAILFPVSMAAFGQPALLKLDIRSSFELAREWAPSLLLATYKVDVAEAEEDLARAQILPQVNVFGEWSETRLSIEAGF